MIDTHTVKMLARRVGRVTVISDEDRVAIRVTVGTNAVLPQ
jgi:hypothetical protein